MKHRRLASCASTNDEARQAFESGETLPFAISAEEQHAGRGRQGRSWSHDPRNFAGSFVLPMPPVAAHTPGLVALLAGLAIHDALIASGASSPALSLKWPNDVLYNERKVAGVLAEMLSEPSRSALLIGIGVNLAVAPAQARFPAGTVFAAHEAPSPATFGERLGDALGDWMDRLDQRGELEVLDAWRARAWRLGQSLTLRTTDGEASGVFQDIDDTGRIILRLRDGAEQRFAAGDASHR